MVVFMLKQYLSRPFLAEIISFCLLSSSLNFSASLTMRPISSFDRRPLSLVIVILFSFPVLLSQADTFRMPLASMSKVTSICGTPRGAGGMPVRSNLPRRWLSLVMARSPSYTWMVTRIRREVTPGHLGTPSIHAPVLLFLAGVEQFHNGWRHLGFSVTVGLLPCGPWGLWFLRFQKFRNVQTFCFLFRS